MYAILWRFQVKPGLEGEFEKAYGAGGCGRKFFRRRHGYLETEPFRGAAEPGSYVTIDRWESKAAYESFRKSFAERY